MELVCPGVYPGVYPKNGVGVSRGLSCPGVYPPGVYPPISRRALAHGSSRDIADEMVPPGTHTDRESGKPANRDFDVHTLNPFPAVPPETPLPIVPAMCVRVMPREFFDRVAWPGPWGTTLRDSRSIEARQ
jgi:hypothetical protein